jgi:hypothetical protein
MDSFLNIKKRKKKNEPFLKYKLKEKEKKRTLSEV